MGPGAIVRMLMRLFGRYALRRGAQLAASPDARERFRAWLEEGDEPGRARSGKGDGMFERFTDRARRVVVRAQEEARALGHPSIGTEHLLLGLLDDPDGLAAAALRRLELDPEDLRGRAEALLGPREGAPEERLAFTSGAKKSMEFALRESVRLGHGYIGTEHLLLGLVREGEGAAAQVLHDVVPGGLEEVRVAVLTALAEAGPGSESRAAEPVDVIGAQLREEQVGADVREPDLQEALDRVTLRLEAIEARLEAIERLLRESGIEAS